MIRKMVERLAELQKWLEPYPGAYDLAIVIALLLVAWLANWVTKRVLLRGLRRALRATALASLIETLPAKTAAAGLIAALVLSRALMVRHWQALPAAKTSGIAAGAGQPGDSERNIALAIGLLVFILFTLHALPILSIALVLAAAILATVLFGRLCDRKIGGHTGDTIGATQQIAEIGIFCALALAG